MFFLAECSGDPGILRLIYYVMTLAKTLFIVVPIGAVIMISLDMAKTIMSSKDEFNKYLSVSIKRIIYCAIVFLVPTIVSSFIAILGNLKVDFVSTLECIDLNKIEQLAENNTLGLIDKLKKDMDYKSLTEAKNSLNSINDKDLKESYSKEIKDIQEQIDKKIKEENEVNYKESDKKHISGPSGGNTGIVDISNFDDATINLLAAGITMEAGFNPVSFKCQLLVGSVMTNNLYKDLSGKNRPPIKSSPSNTTYEDLKNLFSQCPTYCNKGGSKWGYIAAKGDGLTYMKSKGATDAMINQAQTVAKILLTRFSSVILSFSLK